MYTGGSIWALEWCPHHAITHPPHSSASPSPSKTKTLKTRYIAIGCHPITAPRNPVGAIIKGPGIIQLWQVVVKSIHNDVDEEEDVPLPSFAYGINHNGGLVWDLSWCPVYSNNNNNSSNSSNNNKETGLRLGLLAAALGDGGVRIWSVPIPEAVPTSIIPDQHRIVNLPVVASIHADHLDGSTPNLVDWLPHSPHDLLLVGCWDGSVAICRLEPGVAGSSGDKYGDGDDDMEIDGTPSNSGSGSSRRTKRAIYGSEPRGMKLLAKFSAECIPLRALKWAPPSACQGNDIAGVGRHCFLTAGHEGIVKIWDARNQYEPQYQQYMSTFTLMEAAWSNNPLGIVLGEESGFVKGIPLDPKTAIDANRKSSSRILKSTMYRGDGRGAVWSIDVHRLVHFAAYGGEDGEVGVMEANFSANRKGREGHVSVAGFKVESGVLTMKTSEELKGSRMVYFKGAKMQVRKGLPIPDVSQAIHKVRWSREKEEDSMLAFGGYAGVLRCVRVSVVGSGGA